MQFLSIVVLYNKFTNYANNPYIQKGFANPGWAVNMFALSCIPSLSIMS